MPGQNRAGASDKPWCFSCGPRPWFASTAPRPRSPARRAVRPWTPRSRRGRIEAPARPCRASTPTLTRLRLRRTTSTAAPHTGCDRRSNSPSPFVAACGVTASTRTSSVSTRWSRQMFLTGRARWEPPPGPLPESSIRALTSGGRALSRKRSGRPYARASLWDGSGPLPFARLDAGEAGCCAAPRAPTLSSVSLPDASPKIARSRGPQG